MADRRLAKLIAFASLVAIATAYNGSTPEPGSLASTALPYNVTLNRTADPSPLPTTEGALKNSSRYAPDQNNSTASNSSRPDHPDHPGAANGTAAWTPENSTLPQVPEVNVTVGGGNVTHDWLPRSSEQPPRNETDLVLYDVVGAKSGPSEAEKLDEAEELEMLPIKQDADNANDADIGGLRSVLGQGDGVHVTVVEDTTTKFHVPVVEDTTPAAGRTSESTTSTPTTPPRKPITDSSPASNTGPVGPVHEDQESTTKGAVAVSSSFLTPLALLATLLFLH